MSDISLRNRALYQRLAAVYDLAARLPPIARPRARLLEMNAERLDLPDASFDVVIMSYVLSVVGDPRRALAEAARALAPEGSIWILGKFYETPAGLARRVLSRALTAVGGARLTLSLDAIIGDTRLRVSHRETGSRIADIIQLSPQVT
jgi:ubiquinone/menaquinone biosynthesis C-methylase UbiE